MTYKILIVDDDDDIRQVVSTRLKFHGYDIIEASSGEEAIEKAEEKPDLMLLDIMMPRMSGLEVCQKIRAQGHKVKIIFLSAKNEDWDLLQGYHEGGDSYLVKPVMVDVLLEEIKKMLGETE